MGGGRGGAHHGRRAARDRRQRGAGRNTTTSTPSPRLVTATVDLTLETGGKRGYRIAQATQLSEAARLNVASIAWQVHSRVRSELAGALRRSGVREAAEPAAVAPGRERAHPRGAISRRRDLRVRAHAGAVWPPMARGWHCATPSVARPKLARQLAAPIGLPVPRRSTACDFSFDELRSVASGARCRRGPAAGAAESCRRVERVGQTTRRANRRCSSRSPASIPTFTSARATNTTRETTNGRSGFRSRCRRIETAARSPKHERAGRKRPRGSTRCRRAC